MYYFFIIIERPNIPGIIVFKTWKYNKEIRIAKVGGIPTRPKR